mmetsp:Transcript_72622/g.200386  ORF Transcript_72622/g.200386 Transcript_72622/m.200386 type:complete len:334 (-) Transcript_72622:782-1783(-)
MPLHHQCRWGPFLQRLRAARAARQRVGGAAPGRGQLWHPAVAGPPGGATAGGRAPRGTGAGRPDRGDHPPEVHAGVRRHRRRRELRAQARFRGRGRCALHGHLRRHRAARGRGHGRAGGGLRAVKRDGRLRGGGAARWDQLPCADSGRYSTFSGHPAGSLLHDSRRGLGSRVGALGVAHGPQPRCRPHRSEGLGPRSHRALLRAWCRGLRAHEPAAGRRGRIRVCALLAREGLEGSARAAGGPPERGRRHLDVLDALSGPGGRRPGRVAAGAAAQLWRGGRAWGRFRGGRHRGWAPGGGSRRLCRPREAHRQHHHLRFWGHWPGRLRGARCAG